MAQTLQDINAGATFNDAPAKTEDQLLADILRSSAFTPDMEESLPEAADVPTPGQEDDDDDRPVPAPEDEVVEEAVEEETTDEDDESTQEADVFDLDDLDDFKVNVKIDGENVPVSLDELVKGYATNQSLSNKGRELGNARKQFDEERSSKLNEIESVAAAANQILGKAEQDAAKEYHSIEAKIKEAREEGDSYRVSELKDDREVAQQKYWSARNEREQMMATVNQQKSELEAKEWSAKMDKFGKEITEAIPDWSDELAGEIREFAISKGISEELLSTMVDVNAIKFVDDFRRMEKAKSKGAVKREAAPKRNIPVKKSRTQSEKNAEANSDFANKVLSGEGTKADEHAFLRGLVSKHFE